MEQINLSDVLQEIGKHVEAEVVLEPEFLQAEAEKKDSPLYDGDICRVTDIEPFALAMTNLQKGKAVLSGRTTVRGEFPCDRCLKPVKINMDVSFEREVLAPELLGQNADQAEDQKFMDGYLLSPERLLQEEILINLPAKILCREDCKGICAVCGHDLNEGDCGCDTFVPDPRMAAIADLFKN